MKRYFLKLFELTGFNDLSVLKMPLPDHFCYLDANLLLSS